MPAGTLYGKLVEASTLKPIEFASVQLIQNKFDSISKKRKDVVIGGMITRANGEFRLENVPAFGPLKLRVSVVGYKPYEQNVSFDLKRPDNNANNNGDMSAMLGMLDKDLGNIKIDIADKVLENVTVTASNPGLRLGIDRKVFNVDKDLVSAGGTAVDVMRNVPSISVDIDGNVTMRNNTPQIFVDGRPTTMTLDQIPADVIESVEIITNPSAKFDASGGTAGILNVVLKKNKKVGYNGGTRFNLDSRGRVGAGGDINLRQEKINVFLNANYHQRKSISDGTTDRTTLIGTPQTKLYQTDHSISQGRFMFFRGGFDYFVDNRNTISLAANIGSGNFKPVTTSNIYVDSLYNPVTSSLNIRTSNNKSKMENKGIMLSYKHNFPKSGQEWTADVTYNRSESNSSNLIQTDYYKLPQNTLSSVFKQRQDGAGDFKNFIAQTDYVQPINDKSKVEAGLRVSVRKVDSRNSFYFFDPSGNAIYNPLLSVNYNSTDKIYAAYTTYSNQVKNFGYQLGLRIESSDYQGNLPDKGQSFNIKFPVSLFPSVFLSNKMKNDQELQLNYTRKINRPNFFQLYPYTDYSDSLNISRGNPDLKPEFTNSVELSYQKIFKKNKDNFLASLYFKNTNDLITRYQVKEVSSVTGKDVLVNTYINANSAYVTGLEMTLKNKVTKWWDLTSNINLFTSKINIPDQASQDQFASWFGKLNNTFKLLKNFTLQLSGNYQSKTVLPPGGSGGEGGGRGGGGMFGGGGPGGGMFGQTTTSQGYVRANYWVDAAFKYEFLKNKQASISLNINDIFRTRRSDVHSESSYFIQDVFRRRDPQVLRLNFSWRFGKFDPNLFKRKNMRNQSDGSENINMGQ
ncbi:MAG: TonB-dependent receptor [Sphingobacteriales bacterium]|nr:TonB-dependent receptor [Sphingobacteriales bacterium]